MLLLLRCVVVIPAALSHRSLSLSLSQYEFAASDARSVRRETFAGAAAAYQAAAWVALALPPTPTLALALPSIVCSRSLSVSVALARLV